MGIRKINNKSIYLISKNNDDAKLDLDKINDTYIGFGGHATLNTGLTDGWKLNDTTSCVGRADMPNPGSGVSFVSGGVIGDCASFDGVNDELSQSANTYSWKLTSDAYSFSGWIKLLATSTEYNFWIPNATGASKIRVGVLASREIDFLLFDGANNLRTTTSSGVLTSTAVWYHVCVTYSGSGVSSGMKIYLNGTLQSVNRSSAGSLTDFTMTRIRISHSTFLPFGGLQDDVYFWEKELTSGEITDLYNSGSGSTY